MWPVDNKKSFFFGAPPGSARDNTALGAPQVGPYAGPIVLYSVALSQRIYRAVP